MKKIFMSLILCVLTAPLQANQSREPYECLKTYENYLKYHDIGRDQMMQYMDNCMPAKPVMNDEPLHRKLLQIVDDDKRIITIRT